MGNVTEEKWIEMLEKKSDGNYIVKYPKVKSKSGVTFDEHLAEEASQNELGHIKFEDVGIWQKIDEIIVSTAVAQVDIVVPNGYKEIRLIGKNIKGSNVVEIALRLNNKSGDNYVYTTATLTTVSTKKGTFIPIVPDSSNFGNFDYYINVDSVQKHIYGFGAGSALTTDGNTMLSASCINIGTVTSINLFGPTTIGVGSIFEVWGR